MSRPNSEIIALPDVRLSFASLWTPRHYNQGGDGDGEQQSSSKPRYEATFLLDPNKAEHKKVITKIRAEAKKLRETFSGKGKVKVDCFGLADEDEMEYDGWEGMFYVRANARDPRRPKIVDRDPSIPLYEKDGKPYSGCYVNGRIQLWAQSASAGYGNRINSTLLAVQFKRDGEPFSNAPEIDPESMFSDESEDGGDDDGSFLDD